MGENSGGPGPPEDFNLHNVLHRGEMPHVNETIKKSYKTLKHSFFTHPSDSEKYFVLSGEDIRNMNVFEIQKGLEKLSKHDFKVCTRLPSGDMLIQTRDVQQLEAVKATTVFGLDKKPVQVSENGVLNQSHAIIRCREIMKLDTKVIQEGLAEQKVINVQRLKRREGNGWIDTATHVLTLSSPLVPAEIKVGFLTVKTEIYIPAPFRCVLCQRLGHTKKRCNSKQNKHLCGFCAEEFHLYGPCLPPKCVNCKGSHPSSSKNCPKYIEEKEVNAIRVTMRIPYNLAREELRKRKNAPISTRNMTASPPTSSNSRSSERLSYAQIITSQLPTNTSNNTVSKTKSHIVNLSPKAQRVDKLTNKAFKRKLAEENLQSKTIDLSNQTSIDNIHTDSHSQNETILSTKKLLINKQSNYSNNSDNISLQEELTNIPGYATPKHCSPLRGSSNSLSPAPLSISPPTPRSYHNPSTHPPKPPDPTDDQLPDYIEHDSDIDMHSSPSKNFHPKSHMS